MTQVDHHQAGAAADGFSKLHSAVVSDAVVT
jgi:hypothetical protein